MRRWRETALIAATAFLAALGGTYAGRAMLASHHGASGTALHRLLHEDLELDGAQHAALEQLESGFAIRRRALEMEMRADNARLASAIQTEHGNGPQVAAAIDRSHHAMGELQKETIAHVFAMRRLLRRDQAERFDKAVVRALTDDSQ
jgi:hypothetical protein